MVAGQNGFELSKKYIDICRIYRFPSKVTVCRSLLICCSGGTASLRWSWFLLINMSSSPGGWRITKLLCNNWNKLIARLHLNYIGYITKLTIRDLRKEFNGTCDGDIFIRRNHDHLKEAVPRATNKQTSTNCDFRRETIYSTSIGIFGRMGIAVANVVVGACRDCGRLSLSSGRCCA